LAQRGSPRFIAPNRRRWRGRNRILKKFCDILSRHRDDITEPTGGGEDTPGEKILPPPGPDPPAPRLWRIAGQGVAYLPEENPQDSIRAFKIEVE